MYMRARSWQAPSEKKTQIKAYLTPRRIIQLPLFLVDEEEDNGFVNLLCRKTEKIIL